MKFTRETLKKFQREYGVSDVDYAKMLAIDVQRFRRLCKGETTKFPGEVIEKALQIHKKWLEGIQQVKKRKDIEFSTGETQFVTLLRLLPDSEKNEVWDNVSQRVSRRRPF